MKSLVMVSPLVLIVHFFVSTEFGRADEPTASADKPLSTLIEDLKSADRATRVQAAEAIGRMGPKAKDAASALREATRAHDGRFPDYIFVALWKVAPDTYEDLLRGKGTSAERNNALLGLASIGVGAKRFAPIVLEIAGARNDPSGRSVALACLADIGADLADALPLLVNAINKTEGNSEQMFAARTLAKYGAKAKEALPALHKALQHPDVQVRVEAAHAVWKVENNGKQALPVLTVALQFGKDLGAQAAGARAVRVLGEIGPPAKDAFPELIKLWKATSGDDRTLKRVHDETAKALKMIDAKAAIDAGVK